MQKGDPSLRSGLISLEAPPTTAALMPQRREFLSQLGLAAAALAMDADELRAESAPQQSTWDTSWLDRLAKARYRVVFNASVIDDGGVFSYASTFFDQYHEVHNTADAETTPVVVFRRLGTPMALNDHLWDRYELGKETKTDDRDTGTAARRRRPRHRDCRTPQRLLGRGTIRWKRGDQDRDAAQTRDDQPGLQHLIGEHGATVCRASEPKCRRSAARGSDEPRPRGDHRSFRYIRVDSRAECRLRIHAGELTPFPLSRKSRSFG